MDQVDHSEATDTTSIIIINDEDEDEDDDMMISAAAASSALMGENIIDSPNTRSHKTNPRFFHPAQQEDTEMKQEHLPDLPDLNTTMEKSIATAGLNSSSHHRDRASCDPNNNNHNATSVGIVAQGLAWAKQQKYKRQRQYLQHQAEQQLLKLQLATTTTTTSTTETQSMQQQKSEIVDDVNVNENTDKSNKRSLFFDPTSLQNWIESLTSIPVLSTQQDDVESDHHRRRRNMGRTNSAESISSNKHDPNTSVSVNDNDTDRTENGNTSSYQFCNISQSGLGYSVALPTLFNTPPSQATTTTTTTSTTMYQQNTTSTIDNDTDDDTSWIPQVRVEDATSYDDYNSAIHSDHSNDNDDDCTTNMQPQENHNINVTETIEEVRPPYLLSSDEMYQIAVNVLPRNIVYCKWKRYYSLVRDGDSFDNCLRQVQHCKQSLMIIRTTKNYRFGTYVDAPWDTTHSLQHGTIQYYGGPETCLFKIVNDNIDTGNNDDTTQNNSSSSSGGGKVICYKWSGMNRYIQLCDHQHKMIAIGGGNGTFGLCIQQDFQYGSTGSCATFNNEPLCPDEQFSILDIEIYGFLLGQF